MVISGRSALFLLGMAVVVGGVAVGLYYLLLPKFKKWHSKFGKGYKKYEKNEVKKS